MVSQQRHVCVLSWTSGHAFVCFEIRILRVITAITVKKSGNLFFYYSEEVVYENNISNVALFSCYVVSLYRV